MSLLIRRIHDIVEYSDGRGEVVLFCDRLNKSKLHAQFNYLYPDVTVVKINSLNTSRNMKKFYVKVADITSFKKYIQ